MPFAHEHAWCQARPRGRAPLRPPSHPPCVLLLTPAPPCVQVTDWNISVNIDRHKYTESQMERYIFSDVAATNLYVKLMETYAKYAPLFMEQLGFPPDVVTGMDVVADMLLGSLQTNEGDSECSVHHDPNAPLPALICGPTVWWREGGAWKRRAHGGKLMLVDGMFNLEYGPRDVVLLDGSFLHGVSRLQELGGTQHMESRPQLSRFSMIVFNRWNRAKRISRAWSGEWCESWRDAVPWK